MPVITHAIDSRDGVFTGGKHLHNTFKPMTTSTTSFFNESTISGGRVTRCGTVHTFLSEKVGEDNNTGAMR
jgi:hypothetical protein